MSKPLYQPTKAVLDYCSIGGVNWVEAIGSNGEIKYLFHVKEFRCFEDICKSYFTAELVIETLLNAYEKFLYPTAEVVLRWESPRSDGGNTKTYSESYRVFSYESTPLSGGADARVEHKISLIGQEYYNDKHNVVIQNFFNQTGTAAAASVHNKYMATNGGLRITPPSTGMIGQDSMKHQTINKKPIKAIHDILDRCIWSAFPSCAPTYFRDVNGYVMAPLQSILENAAIVESFSHDPAIAANLRRSLVAYNQILHLRPVAPAGETSSGVGAGEISGLVRGTSFFDAKTKNIVATGANLGGIGGWLSKLPNAKHAKETVSKASKSFMGGLNMFHIIDELLQSRSVDKNGPGQFNAKQEAFLTALSYSPKYWLSVPSQTGLNVTCGKRINISYPIGNRGEVENLTLFVPRLIHEVRFTQDTNRKPTIVNATTDIYGVRWSN